MAPRKESRGIPVNQTTRGATTKQSLLGLAVAAVGMIVLACGPGPGPVTTTTASTTTTSSTTTTTLPGCDGSYTPTGVVLSDSTASPGDVITVSGNGKAGTQISLKLVKVPSPGIPSSTVNTGVTATVAPNGTWATALTLPVTMTTGQWNVVATSVPCGTSSSALISIV